MNLVENQFGHGARVHGKLHNKVRRFFRKNVGTSTIPFDLSSADVHDAIPQ